MRVVRCRHQSIEPNQSAQLTGSYNQKVCATLRGCLKQGSSGASRLRIIANCIVLSLKSVTLLETKQTLALRMAARTTEAPATGLG